MPPRYSDAIEEARRRREWFEEMQRKLRREADALEPVIAAVMAEEQELARLEDEESTAGTTSDLHSRSQSASMNDVNATARLNMSRSNSDDPFVKACRAKGLTQNDVAKRLKIPRSLLSMYRAGVRRIPQDRAEAIEALTGWKATPKNWPGGILAAD